MVTGSNYIPIRVDTMNKYQHLEPIISFGEIGSAYGLIASPNSLVIDENLGYIHIVNTRSACVTVFSLCGDFITAFSDEKLSYPCGVAVHADSIYVTNDYRNTIHRFGEDSGYCFRNMVGTLLPGESNLIVPNNLAISKETGDLYVVEAPYERVHIFNAGLHHKSIFTESVPKPCDVKLTADEVFIMSSIPYYNIHVLSYQACLKRIIQMEYEPFCTGISVPKFFCLDRHNNIFISEKRIKIYSGKDGILLYSFSWREDELQGYTIHTNPRGIAISNDFKLVVISNYNQIRICDFCNVTSL